ncbi:hypothetical protein DMN91_000971 [Ooceraea biroi]|uniref:Reverse transcriptase domain-containing protein n=2 Tax=Ooceraea biroi TaxID=2015173 RepID=A0A3L8E3P4_OOCBI|nr:hypothetical protein DMN91_000971 [Ooceraea biroi]
MDEYKLLGHMKLVNVPADEEAASFYLPHHAVFKKSDKSSRIRVVFDASCKLSTGYSLNDALFVGPVVQQDLVSILMRFRTFRYVITADIVKMYRQILIDPSQACLQRVLWRSNIEFPVEVYELTTVTYGTASASYLATRCLKHLADQHEARYPTGSDRVKRDFYVDDLLTRADTLDEVRLIGDEVVELLRLGAFELSKWASNAPEVLENFGDQGF